jgi:hypothetical protein
MSQNAVNFLVAYIYKSISKTFPMCIQGTQTQVFKRIKLQFNTTLRS